MSWIRAARSTHRAVLKIPLLFRSASRSCGQPQAKFQNFFGRILSCVRCHVLMNWNLQQMTAEEFGVRSGAMTFGITAVPELDGFYASLGKSVRGSLFIFDE